jgi:hypothetical protein
MAENYVFAELGSSAAKRADEAKAKQTTTSISLILSNTSAKLSLNVICNCAA